MLICGIESSAKAVSAAIMRDAAVIGEYFVNTKQTHSETLMPMLEHLMGITGITAEDVDLFAVAAGPGSFTGVRIGVSCVKGMAFPHNTDCCAVSTLEAIACMCSGSEGKIICAVMDARRNQVYNANFKIQGGIPIRLTEDRAIPIDELYSELREYGASVVLCGDGAELCYGTFKECGALLADNKVRLQRASAVAEIAVRMAEEGRTVKAAELVPLYLRPSQAERELSESKRENQLNINLTGRNEK